MHGSFIEGIFEGVVRTDEGTYYVEKSGHFFKDKPGFHSVIYRSKDMDSDPHRYVLLGVTPTVVW